LLLLSFFGSRIRRAEVFIFFQIRWIVAGRLARLAFECIKEQKGRKDIFIFC
jgi:hypothetical protein